MSVELVLYVTGDASITYRELRANLTSNERKSVDGRGDDTVEVA